MRDPQEPVRIYARGVTSEGIVSELIRDHTHSKVSHVEFILDADWHDALFALADNTTRIKVAQQMAALSSIDYGTLGAHLQGGVAIRPTAYQTFTFIHNFHIECTWAQKQVVMDKALACVGDRYSVQAIMDCLTGCNTIKPKQYDCSYFVNDMLRAAGLLMQRVDDGAALITPRDVVMSPIAVPDLKEGA